MVENDNDLKIQSVIYFLSILQDKTYHGLQKESLFVSSINELKALNKFMLCVFFGRLVTINFM